MENRASPTISTRPIQQIIDPNDFPISLRPVQQIIDPNDFTLFGNVEDCPSDQNAPKLRDKIEESQSVPAATDDKDTSTSSVQCIKKTTKSNLLTPVETGGIDPAKPPEVIITGEELKKSNALVLIDKNYGSEKLSSNLTNTINNEPKNTDSLSEPLPTLRGEVTGEQSTINPNNSTSAENSSLRALLVCDGPLPAPSTSNDEQTNQAMSSKTDTPIQTSNSPREVVILNSCTLFPPKTGSSLLMNQKKPPGCKTVRVGGFPYGATEEMIREIFERFGKIVDLKLEKRFCNVRFEQASAVDLAYSLKEHIVARHNYPSRGLLFVEYVKSKEDELEWESQQLKFQIQDHPTAIEKTRQSSSSPFVYCTESDITKVSEMIKRDDRFLEAVQLLSRWLEMDDYDKKNSDKIYLMIQETNAHATRLQTEKKRQYEEMKKFRNKCRGKAEVISSQISHIERLFAITSQKKVLDHFTDTQKASLILWKTEFLKYQDQIENLSTEIDDLALLGADEELAMKNSKLKEKKTLIENSANSRAEIEISALKNRHETELASKNEEIQKLKLSLKSLKRDLKNAEETRVKKDKKTAYKGYSILERKLKDCTHDLTKERKFVVTLQIEISELKRRLADEENNNKQLITQMKDSEREYKHTVAVLNQRLCDKEEALGETERRMSEIKINQEEVLAAEALNSKVLNQRKELARLTKLRAEDKERIKKLQQELWKKPPVETINVRDARTISMISSFLLIHPYGVGIHFITEYVQRMEPTASSSHVQDILCKYSGLFILDVVKNKWTLNVHAQTDSNDKWTDESSSTDASSENAAGNSSQTKRASSRTRSPTSRIKRPVGTHAHSSVISSEIKPVIAKVGQLVGTNQLAGFASQLHPPAPQIGQIIEKSHLSNPTYQIQPPTSQIEQPVHSAGLTSQIQPPTSHIEHSVGTGHISSQIQPTKSQIGQSVGTTLQSSGLAPKIQPLLSQILPQSSPIQPQSCQMQPQSPHIEEQGGNIALRPNGLTTFAEEIRLMNMLQTFRFSYEWSAQLLRRLQEISVFRNQNTLWFRANRRSGVKVVVPIVSDEEREIYKLTVTIPDEYPEEELLRRSENSEEFSSDNISETSMKGYYRFNNQNKNVQYSSSPTSPTSDGNPQNVCKIVENTPDSAFKAPKDLPSSSQNQNSSGFWSVRADNRKSKRKIAKAKAEEEHRLARIVSYFPNHLEWSSELHARLRFFKPCKSPQLEQEIVLRNLDGEQVKVYLPRMKLKTLAKLNIAIPDKYPEEYILDRTEKFEDKREITVCEGKQGDYSNENAGTLNFKSVSPEEATNEEPIGLTTNPLKSPENSIPAPYPLESHQSKKYDDVSTANQPSKKCCTLQPQIPYRKPPMLIIKQDQHNQSLKKRHCPEDPQEPPAKIKKITPDDSNSCSGQNVQHSEATTPLIDESIANKVSEVRKSSKKLQLNPKLVVSLTADDKANASVKGDTKQINQEENTEKNVETKFPGSGKSDGECLQIVANLDITKDKKLLQPSKSSVHSQSSQTNKGSDTESGGKGSKQGAIKREKLLHDREKSRRSSKEVKNNRQKITENKRASSIKDESKEREHKNIYSGAKNSHREKETVVGNVDKHCDDEITKKHRREKSKDIKIRHRELPKDDDESLSVDSGGNNKDAAKKELDRTKVSSDSTSDAEAKCTVSSETSDRESCDRLKNDPEMRTIEKPARPTKELNERLQKLFNSSNESVTFDSQENSSKEDSTQPENIPEDKKSLKNSLVYNEKIISVDASEKSGALEKSNKRYDFVRDTTKGRAEDHISSAVENFGTSSGSSKRPRNISNNEDENVHKDLGEKSSKDLLVSNKKIISVDVMEISSSLEKSNKREDSVRDTSKSSAENQISSAVENSGTSSGTSNRSRNISKDKDEGLTLDAEQESRKNFDQKCEDFRKKYLEYSKKKTNNSLGGKGLDNKVPNKKQTESPIVSMTFAEYLSSQRPKDLTEGNDLVKKLENVNNDEEQLPIDSRSSSEKTRKRCSGKEDTNSSKKSATAGHWEDVMHSLDCVPKKRSESIKLSQISHLKKNVGQRTLEIPVKSSKPLEKTPDHQVEKKQCRSSSKPNLFPRIRINFLKIRQNSSKTKKKTSVASNKNSTDAEESIKETTCDPLKVSAEKTAQRQSKERKTDDPGILLINQATNRETQELRNPTKDMEEIEPSIGSIPHVDQRTEPSTSKVKPEICRRDKEVKKEQLSFQMGFDEPKLEKYESVLKEDLLETDEKEHIYEASSKNAQDLRNELQQLFGDVQDPEDLEDASGPSEKLDDYYCDTYLSSADILMLSGEGPGM